MAAALTRAPPPVLRLQLAVFSTNRGRSIRERIKSVFAK
jgi:hypothetical protein